MNKLHDRSAYDRSVLSGQIVSIAFWTMAMLGFVGMAVLLGGGLRDAVQTERESAVNLFMMQLAQQLGGRDPAHLDPATRELLRRADLRGVEIHVHGRRLQIGAIGVSDATVEHTLAFNDVAGLPSTARVIVHDKPVAQRIEARRKHAILALGLTLLVFGFGLNAILRRVLGRPFVDMIATARAYASGQTSSRFNAQRRDEFGFLATFINRALDAADAREAALKRAADRAHTSEAALALEKERALVTLYSIGDGVITTDGNGRIEYLNPVALTLAGWTLADAVGRLIEEVLPFVHEDSNAILPHPARISLDTDTSVDADPKAMLRTRDGRLIPVTASAAPIAATTDQGARGVVCVIYDTTHERVMARELSWQATHDDLTGLANRREFEHALREFVDTVHAGSINAGALLYLDIDHFKIVNDTHGHAAGDEILRQFGRLLQDSVRDSDLVARLGGDEFGILLSGCDTQHALQVAHHLLSRAQQSHFVWSTHHFEVGLSIGFVAITAATESGAEVLRAADIACYDAKEAGRNAVYEYHADDAQLRNRERQMDWASRVRAAIQRDTLVLYCQPIARIATSEPEIVHHEILLRWRDDTGAIVAPAEFIAAAEKYHMMPQVDRWVVRHVLAQLRSASTPASVVTINLSGQTLSRAESLGTIVDDILSSGVSPEQLIFEITETAAIANLVHAKKLIQVLRGMGCRFALDDFGSGMSSLSYIRDLDVSFIKIDGQFVRNLNTTPVDRALVEAAHRIGEVLGIETVGEWAESADIIAGLRAVGVHYAQGYGIAKPFPFAELCNDAPAAKILPLRPSSRATV